MAVNAPEFFPQLDRGGSARNAGSTNSSARSSKSGSTLGIRKSGSEGDSSSSFLNELETVSTSSSSSNSRPQSGAEKSHASVPFTPERASLDENRADLAADSTQKVAAFNNFMAPAPGVQRPGGSSQVGQASFISESMGDVETAKGALRQKFVLEFMSQMQNQFGVEPESLLNAFSELDENALFGRPEDAMGQFLAHLQLTPQQSIEAARLYQNMVTQTGDEALNEQLGQGRPVSVQVMDERDYKTLRMRDSLDVMSNRFFHQPSRNMKLQNLGESQYLGMNPRDVDSLGLNADGTLDAMNESGQTVFDPKTGLEMPAANEQPLQAQSELQSLVNENSMTSQEPSQSSDESASSEKRDKKRGGIPLVGLGAAMAATAASASSAGAQTGIKAAQSSADPISSMSQSSDVSTMSALNGDETNLGDLGSEDSGSEDSGNNGESSFSEFGQNSSPSVPLGAAAASGLAAGAGASAFSAKLASAAYGSSKSGEKNSERSSESADVLAGAAGAGLTTQATATDGKQISLVDGMIARQPQPTAEQQQQNVQELVRQAQVIMKKGGGEMKIQLAPEGMGQVNLKVAVQEGQVNVQMITENDSVKRLLENGLKDLKSQLAAHNLRVDSLKVDLNPDAGLKKFEHQANSDAQREQARQMASDFLGNFRDDRQAFRNDFMDRPGFRSYNRGQKRAAIEPDQIESSSAARSKRNSDSSRRLNLVA